MLRRQNKPMKVLVSGGHHLDRAAEELLSRGFDVLIAEADPISGRHQSRAKFSKNLDLLQEWADVLVLLPDWTLRDDSRLHVLVARGLGVPVFEYSTMEVLRSRAVHTAVTKPEIPSIEEVYAYEDPLQSPGA